MEYIGQNQGCQGGTHHPGGNTSSNPQVSAQVTSLVSVGRIPLILNDVQLQSTHSPLVPPSIGWGIVVDHWSTISSSFFFRSWCYCAETVIKRCPSGALVPCIESAWSWQTWGGNTGVKQVLVQFSWLLRASLTIPLPSEQKCTWTTENKDVMLTQELLITDPYLQCIILANIVS